jgi:putative methionine-R-sulfoxide reductase with GAF domain
MIDFDKLLPDIQTGIRNHLTAETEFTVTGLASVFRQIIESVVNGVGGCAGCIVLLDTEDRTFERIYSYGYGDDFEWWKKVEDGDGRISECIEQGRVLFDPDVRDLEKYVPLCPETVSQISVPLQDPLGGIYGAVALEFSREYDFAIEAWVKSASPALSTLVEYVDHFHFTNRAALAMNAVRDCAKTIDEQRSIESIVDALSAIVGGGEIAILRRYGGDLTVEASRNIVSSEIPNDVKVGILKGQGYTGAVAHSRRSFYCKNTADRTRYPYYRPVVESTLSQFTTPLIFWNELIGVVNVGANIPYAFSSRDRELINNCATQAASLLFFQRLLGEILTLSHKTKQRLDFPAFIAPALKDNPAVQTDAFKAVMRSIEEARSIVSEAEYPFRDRDVSALDLADVISEVLKAHRPLIDAYGIDLEINIRKGSRFQYIASDRHIEDIAENLLFNAIAASNRSVEKRISVSLLDRDIMSVRYFVIRVSNTGTFSKLLPEAGSEAIQYLFRPGERLIAGTGGPELRGLGLWLIDRILAGYGGYLAIEEEENTVTALAYLRQ